MPPPPSSSAGRNPLPRSVNGGLKSLNQATHSATQLTATQDEPELTQGFATSSSQKLTIPPPNAAGRRGVVFSTTTSTSAAAQPKPRLHIPQEQIDSDIKMAQEGKVTVKNAWDMKIIESMPQTVESALGQGVAQLLEAAAAAVPRGRPPGSNDASAEGDEYATFSRMANVVESGAKVWTHRVDNTYQLSMQMVRRVLRAEAGGKDHGDGDLEEGAEGAGGEAERKAARRRKAAIRTIADSVDEINIEKKGAAAAGVAGGERVSETISPLFRAITKRYDQGHASGLLLHNAPLGLVNNLIIDVDYSLPKYRNFGRRQQQGTRRGAASASTYSVDDVVAGVIPYVQDGDAEARRSGTTGGADFLEAGLDMYDNSHLTHHQGAENDEVSGDDAYLSHITQICQLQTKLEESASRLSATRSSVGGGRGSTQENTYADIISRNTNNNFDATAAAARLNTSGAHNDDEDGYDNGDWGGGGDDDDDYAGNENGGTGAATSSGSGLKPEGDEDKLGSGGVSRYSGSVDPRALASGAHELSALYGGQKMEAIDDDGEIIMQHLDGESGYFGGYGGDQDDGDNNIQNSFGRISGRNSQVGGAYGGVNDSSWVAFSQASTDILAKRRDGALLPGKSNLSKIRSQCGVANSAAGGVAGATTTSTTTARKTGSKAVSFIETDELLDEAAIRDCLKSNPTNATALTPIGKEVLGYAPSHVTLQAFGSEYSMCEKRAVLHRLVTPIVSKLDILDWMPLDVTNVRVYYQPDCTENTMWGALRKTRHNQQLPVGAITAASNRHHNLNVVDDGDEGNDNGGGDDGADFVAEMPIDVFEDDFDDANDGPDGDDDDFNIGRFSATADSTAANPFSFAAPPSALDALVQANSDESTFGRFSGADAEGGGEGRLSLLEGPQMINVLSIRHATTPTQVDVVRLRQCMWEKVLKLSGGVEALHVMGRLYQSEHDRVTGTNTVARRAAAAPIPKHMLDDDYEGDDDENDNESKKYYPLSDVAADADMISAENTSATRAGLGQKRGRDDVAALLFIDGSSPKAKVVPRILRFSDVVTQMLPDTPSFSKSGSLSPAFFFFAILFLANEHRILLQNNPKDLGDVDILGIAAALVKPTPTAD